MSLRHVLERRDPDEVLTIAANVMGVEADAFRQRLRNSVLRAVAARMLCKHAGLTQREAAGVLRVGSGAAVGRQQRKLAEELARDRVLRRAVREIEKRLAASREDVANV